MSGRFTVLAVSSNRVELRRNCRFLRACGYEVRACACVDIALEWLERSPPNILLTQSLEEEEHAQLLQAARKQTIRAYVAALRICDLISPPEALDLIREGWDDLLIAPVTQGELLTRMRSAARVVEFEKRWQTQKSLELSTGPMDRHRWIQQLAIRRQSQVKLAPEKKSPSDSSASDRSQGGSEKGVGFVALVHLISAEDRLGIQFGAQNDLTYPSDQDDFQHAQTLLLKATSSEESPGRWDQQTLCFYLHQYQRTDALAWCESRLEELAEDERASRFIASWGLAPLSAVGDLEDELEHAEEALLLARDSGGDIVITDEDILVEASQSPDNSDAALFTNTTAEDVMQPCPLVLTADETPQQALRVLQQMELSAVVVVDRQGEFLGTVTVDLLRELVQGEKTPEQANSQRFLRQIVQKPPHFARDTSLADLLSFFADQGESSAFAVVTHRKKPIGWIDCQFLASVNAAPTVEDISAVGAPHAGSHFLLVSSGA